MLVKVPCPSFTALQRASESVPLPSAAFSPIASDPLTSVPFRIPELLKIVQPKPAFCGQGCRHSENLSGLAGITGEKGNSSSTVSWKESLEGLSVLHGKPRRGWP